MIERERELATIAERVEAACQGAGAVLVIEGPPGIGKTRLLTEAQARARSAGMEVLNARAGELERHFPFGVVRQLFETRLVGASEGERRRLLQGAAGLAAPLFDLEPPHGAAAAPLANDPFATLHGLYWLSAHLAERAPLLITVDDAHFADAPSFRWLVYLARRVEELPILLSVAGRPDGRGTASEVVSSLGDDQGATVLQPARLSEPAVATLVRARLSADADAEFCQACHTATVGNPFLLEHLLAELATDRVEPTAAHAPRVRNLAPDTIARAVVLRLARLPGAAADLARAVSVLQAGAELRHAAALAGVDGQLAQQAADMLAAAEILAPGRPLDFVHPIVREVIYAELPAGERVREHAHAARLLEDEGAAPEAVAAHLLLTEPSADPAVVEALRAAAGGALARGAPDAVVGYLRRALREPPSERARAHVLWELGTAEARARDPAAAEDLRAALDSVDSPGERAQIALDLGRLLALSGQGAEAIELLTSAISELGDEDRELTLRLEADLHLAAWLASPPRPGVAARLARVRDKVAGRRRGDQLLLANLAFAAFMRGEPADEVASLAERALAGGRLLAEESADSPTFQLAANVLTLTDRLELAEQIYRDAVADARTHGSVIGFAIASCWRSRNDLFRGAVADAEADARHSLAVAREPGWELGLPVSLAFLIDALIERGEPAAAAEALEESGIGEELPESLMFQPLLHSRGRLRMLEGKTHEGLDDLLSCGRRQANWRVRAPGMAPWRVSAAPALAAGGEPAEARRLASAELALARHFGAPRPLGSALRAAGLVEGGEAGVALLREAVAVLEDSPAALEHARALTDLGATMRHLGHSRDAREPLRRGLDLAHRCGASALADRAHEELVATGARPRRPQLAGIDALTPSERRIAGLAAEGLTNPAIAQALFVTLRTVEMHLTHAYQKLGISSRTELAGTLVESGRPVDG